MLASNSLALWVRVRKYRRKVSYQFPQATLLSRHRSGDLELLQKIENP